MTGPSKPKRPTNLVGLRPNTRSLTRSSQDSQDDIGNDIINNNENPDDDISPLLLTPPHDEDMASTGDDANLEARIDDLITDIAEFTKTSKDTDEINTRTNPMNIQDMFSKMMEKLEGIQQDNIMRDERTANFQATILSDISDLKLLKPTLLNTKELAMELKSDLTEFKTEVYEQLEESRVNASAVQTVLQPIKTAVHDMQRDTLKTAEDMRKLESKLMEKFKKTEGDITSAKASLNVARGVWKDIDATFAKQTLEFNDRIKQLDRKADFVDGMIAHVGDLQQLQHSIVARQQDMDDARKLATDLHQSLKADLHEWERNKGELNKIKTMTETQQRTIANIDNTIKNRVHLFQQDVDKLTKDFTVVQDSITLSTTTLSTRTSSLTSAIESLTNRHHTLEQCVKDITARLNTLEHRDPTTPTALDIGQYVLEFERRIRGIQNEVIANVSEPRGDRDRSGSLTAPAPPESKETDTGTVGSRSVDPPPDDVNNVTPPRRPGAVHNPYRKTPTDRNLPSRPPTLQRSPPLRRQTTLPETFRRDKTWGRQFRNQINSNPKNSEFESLADDLLTDVDFAHIDTAASAASHRSVEQHGLNKRNTHSQSFVERYLMGDDGVDVLIEEDLTELGFHNPSETFAEIDEIHASILQNWVTVSPSRTRIIGPHQEKLMTMATSGSLKELNSTKQSDVVAFVRQFPAMVELYNVAVMPFQHIEVKFGAVGLTIPGIGMSRYKKMGRALAKILFDQLIPRNVDKSGKLQQRLTNLNNSTMPNGYLMIWTLLQLFVEPFRPHSVEITWPRYDQEDTIYTFAGMFDVTLQMHRKKGQSLPEKDVAYKFLDSILRQGDRNHRSAALLLQRELDNLTDGYPLPEGRYDIESMSTFIAESTKDDGRVPADTMGSIFQTKRTEEPMRTIPFERIPPVPAESTMDHTPPPIQGFSINRFRVNEAFRRDRQAQGGPFRRRPEPGTAQGTSMRKRTYDPSIQCDACGRKGHPASRCDTLAMAIWIQKYLEQTGNAGAAAKLADEWFARNKEALKDTSGHAARKPSQVLLCYLDRYCLGDSVDAVDDQVDWAYFAQDEDDDGVSDTPSPSHADE